MATFGALVAASLAAAYANGAFRLELIRDAERREQERRAQASLVAGRLGFIIYPEDGPDRVVNSIQVKLRNASQLPVTTVRFDVLKLPDVGAGEVHESHLAGDHFHRRPSPAQSNGRANPAVTQAQHEFNTHGDRAPEHLGLELLFTDSAGVHWKRDWPGRLIDVVSGE